MIVVRRQSGSEKDATDSQRDTPLTVLDDLCVVVPERNPGPDLEKPVALFEENKVGRRSQLFQLGLGPPDEERACGRCVDSRGTRVWLGVDLPLPRQDKRSAVGTRRDTTRSSKPADARLARHRSHVHIRPIGRHPPQHHALVAARTVGHHRPRLVVHPSHPQSSQLGDSHAHHSDQKTRATCSANFLAGNFRRGVVESIPIQYLASPHTHHRIHIIASTVRESFAPYSCISHR